MVFYSKTVLLIIIKEVLIKTQAIYSQFLMQVVVERVKIRKTLIYCHSRNFLKWLLTRNLKKWKIVLNYKNNNYKIVCWCIKREYLMQWRIQINLLMKNCNQKIIHNIINYLSFKNTRQQHKMYSLDIHKNVLKENLYLW